MLHCGGVRGVGVEGTDNFSRSETFLSTMTTVCIMEKSIAYDLSPNVAVKENSVLYSHH